MADLVGNEQISQILQIQQIRHQTDWLYATMKFAHLYSQNKLNENCNYEHLIMSLKMV